MIIDLSHNNIFNVFFSRKKMKFFFVFAVFGLFDSCAVNVFEKSIGVVDPIKAQAKSVDSFCVLDGCWFLNFPCFQSPTESNVHRDYKLNCLRGQMKRLKDLFSTFFRFFCDFF